MPRLLRYVLVWLSCTVCTVTVVFFAVGFVLDSTAQVPPLVRPVATTQSLGVAVTEVASALPTPGDTAGCTGGTGAQSAQSAGGQVTIRFGSRAVCLISAVPAPGFTAQTEQVDAGTLIITFSGGNHRSQLTADLRPRAQVVVRETSW